MIIIKIIAILIALRWFFQTPLQVGLCVAACVLLAKSNIDYSYLERRKEGATTTREISDCDVAKFGLWHQYAITTTVAAASTIAAMQMKTSLKTAVLFVISVYVVVTGIAQTIRAVKH